MKTVIEMAREVGYPLVEYEGTPYIPPMLEVLLEAVRADAIADAVEREREACVKAADDQWVRNPNVSGGDAIRARGQRSDEASLRSNQ